MRLPTSPSEPADACDLEYRRQAPHLWPWTGWYAVVVDGRFLGVFCARADAVAAALIAATATAVLIQRIGHPRSVAVPPADGGAPPVQSGSGRGSRAA